MLVVERGRRSSSDSHQEPLSFTGLHKPSKEPATKHILTKSLQCSLGLNCVTLTLVFPAVFSHWTRGLILTEGIFILFVCSLTVNKHCRDLVRMTICWKASGVVWWICSLGKSQEFSICVLGSWLKLHQRPDSRPRPLAEGLAEDVAEGLSEENPEGYIQFRTWGTSRGNRFTTLHLRLFNRLSF